jgi:hypothetical protein
MPCHGVNQRRAPVSEVEFAFLVAIAVIPSFTAADVYFEKIFPEAFRFPQATLLWTIDASRRSAKPSREANDLGDTARRKCVGRRPGCSRLGRRATRPAGSREPLWNPCRNRSVKPHSHHQGVREESAPGRRGDRLRGYCSAASSKRVRQWAASRRVS